MANRLLGHNGPEAVPEVPEPPKPTGGWAYHHKTGTGKLFQTREERAAAYASGEWVRSPALVPGHKNYKGDAEPKMGICRFFVRGACTRHESGIAVDGDEGGWTPEYEDTLIEKESEEVVARAVAPEPIDFEAIYTDMLSPDTDIESKPESGAETSPPETTEQTIADEAIPQVGRKPSVSDPPIYRKYPSNMSKPQLIAEGAKYGLDLSSHKLTNKDRRKAIRKAKK